MSAVITPVAIVNPDAIARRAARRAEREAYRAAAAAREAAEQHVSDDVAPVPYALTPTAYSALSAPSPAEPLDPAADDWRAILAPALALQITPTALHAMAAAVKSAASSADDVPILAMARVTLSSESVSIVATDRYRVHSLTVPADGEATAEGMVSAKDLADVARALAPAAARKGNMGAIASIRVMVDPDEHTITWESPQARHVTTWEDHMNYPPVEQFLTRDDGRVDVSDWHINPKYLGDALTAAALVAERNTSTHVSADASPDSLIAPMIRVSAGDPSAPAGRFDACIMSVRA